MGYSLTGPITKPINSNPSNPSNPSPGGNQSSPYVKDVIIGSITSGENNITAVKDSSGNVTLTFTLNNGSDGNNGSNGSNQDITRYIFDGLGGVIGSAILDALLLSLGLGVGSSIAELTAQIITLQLELAIAEAKIDILALDIIELQAQNTAMQQQIILLDEKTFYLSTVGTETLIGSNLDVVGDIISNNFFQTVIDNLPRAGIITQF